MQPRGLTVAITAALAFAGLAASAGAQPERPAAHATLMPRSLHPLQLGGNGFQRRERVRVTVTPSSGESVTKRVRARWDGSFVVTFAGVRPCDGLEGVAVGRRGSRASFQFSALICPDS
jgi:hypothetical protein